MKIKKFHHSRLPVSVCIHTDQHWEGYEFDMLKDVLRMLLCFTQLYANN
ncbi:MAG: hypothetical protein JWR38_1450 [Mucilaginibacter sp.]|nr:hypothetical protein [Mucilaginibacter sp.]